MSDQELTPIAGQFDMGSLSSSSVHAQNAQVAALERIVLSVPQTDLGTQMMAHGGLCIRWIFIPKGTVLTGAITKMQNICIVVGEIEVTTEQGPKTMSGFNVLPAEAGSKRAGHAIADTWWATVWKTDLTDPIEIEDEMTDEGAQLQTRRVGINWAARPELGD